MKRFYCILLILVVSLSIASAQTAKKGGFFFELGASGLYTTERLPAAKGNIDTLGAGTHAGIGIRSGSGKGNSMFMLDADLNFTLKITQNNSLGSISLKTANPIDFLQFNASPAIIYFLVDASKFKLGIGPSLNFSLNILKQDGKECMDILFGIGANLTGMIFFNNSVYLNFGLRAIYNPFIWATNTTNNVKEKKFGLITHISVIPKLGIGFKL